LRTEPISDESANKAYGELALPVVESFCGRFLTRSFSRVQAHEAGLQERTVIVEFDSYERALAAHESEAYKKALLRSDPAQNATFASSKALSPPTLADGDPGKGDGNRQVSE